MSRGLRMTRQRRTILRIVETAKQHLDASQILRRARKIDAQIDRVTVYRTLKLLKRHGLVDELDLMHLEGEKHFYERKPQRDHLHMACLRCGKILEFESDLFDRLRSKSSASASSTSWSRAWKSADTAPPAGGLLLPDPSCRLQVVATRSQQKKSPRIDPLGQPSINY